MSGELRIILLVLGLALILVIYFKTRRDDKKKASAGEKRIADPSIYLNDVTTADENAAKSFEEDSKYEPPEPETGAADAVASSSLTVDDESRADAEPDMSAEIPPIVPQRPQDASPPEPESSPPEPESSPPEPESSPPEPEPSPELSPTQAEKPSLEPKISQPEEPSFEPQSPPSQSLSPQSESLPHSASETPLESEQASDSSRATSASADDAQEAGGLKDRLKGHLKKGFNGALNKIFQPDTDTPEERDAAKADENARLLVLHIRAPSDRVFYGREVLFAADKVGLSRGGDEKGTFEKVLIDEHGARRIRFYMADMFEPGVFKWSTFDETRVRGLSLFARLIDQSEAVNLFDEMVACARNVTALLEGAALLDEKHSTLTNQTISHMRDSLREEANKSHLTGA